MRAWGSVRIRVTLLATFIVAVTLTIAAVGLVAAVRSQLLDKVRAAGRAKTEFIATQLKKGVLPDKVQLQEPATILNPGPVTIYNQNGTVVGGTPTGIGPGVAGPGDTVVSVNGPGPGMRSMSFDVQSVGVSTSQGQLTVVASSSLDGIEHDINTLTSTLTLGVPIVVVLVGLVAWVMVGRALHPVEAIRAEVEAISGSTIHRRVPESATGDEIDRLAHTMNAMLDRLESASTSKHRFVSDASHELRSPIASMRTQLEVARSAKDTDWDRVTEGVLAEEARLEDLVDNLLLLASLDEQTTAPRATAVDLATIARDEAGRSRRHPVATRIPAHPVLVEADPQQLRTCTANLLDNADRHATSRVELSVTAAAGRARLTVDDDGPGIPLADRERVFERFTRLDASRARTDGGSGLGLAVTKALTERHRGTITVEDAPIGGARLVLDVPLSTRPVSPS